MKTKTLKTGVTTTETLKDGVSHINVTSPYFKDNYTKSCSPVTQQLTNMFKNLYK